MAIVINGSGTVTGLAVGGLPDGTVDAGTLATNSVDSAELIDGAVDDSHIAALAASKLTGALPAISGASLTGLTSAQMPTGSVLQVVQDFYSGASAGTSSSFANMMSKTITPSSTSSKILIMFSASITSYNTTSQLRLQRDSTVIGVGGASGSRVQSTVGMLHPTSDTNHQSNPTCAQYLDSPNTTSEITYRIQYKVQSGHTMYLNRSGSDANNSDWSHRSASTLTLLEIAG